MFGSTFSLLKNSQKNLRLTSECSFLEGGLHVAQIFRVMRGGAVHIMTTIGEKVLLLLNKHESNGLCYDATIGMLI